MKKIGMLVCVLTAVVLVAGCGGTTGKGKMLVNVNGTKITEGELEFLGTINPRIQAQIVNPEGKKKLLDNLVEQELLYQEAVKEGLSRKDDVKAKVELYRRVIIAQALVDEQVEKAAKKYYDEHGDEFQKLKMAQIMIKYANPADAKKEKDQKKGAKKETMRSEADALKFANDIEARLKKGDDFATVAKEVSDDATTKNRGGDMGPVSKGDKRFESRGWAPLIDKAFEMKVGEVSGPIKTNQGYHIITVTQGLELEPFEEAKAGIVFKVRNDARNELLANLKKEGKVEFADEKKPEKPAEGVAGAGAPTLEGEAAGAAGAPAAPAAEAPKTLATPSPDKASPIKIEVKQPEAKKIAKEAPATEKKPESAVKPAPEQKQ